MSVGDHEYTPSLERGCCDISCLSQTFRNVRFGAVIADVE